MRFSTATVGLAAVLAVSSSLLTAHTNYCPSSTAVQTNFINQGSSAPRLDTRANADSVTIRDSKFLPSPKISPLSSVWLSKLRVPSSMIVLQVDVGTTRAVVKTTNGAFTTDVAGTSGSTLNVKDHSVDRTTWLNRFLQERLHNSKASASNTAGVKTCQSLVN